MSSRANADIEAGHLEVARTMLAEAFRLAEHVGSPDAMAWVCEAQVGLEVEEGHFDVALAYTDRQFDLIKAQRPRELLREEHSRAWILRRMGRPVEALSHMHEAIRHAIALGFAYRNGLNFVAEDYAGILAELGDARGAARLMGAVDVSRQGLGFPRSATVDADIAGSLALAHAALTEHEWGRAYELGRALQLQDALITAETWQHEPQS